jgi:hypothetical protein
MKNT